MSFLKLEQVCKTYDDGTAAVQGIDLACAAGEFVVLLGPSGCGKTTTLRLVAGLEKATAGRIQVAGKDITDLPAAARDVGFVFQFYALYPHLCVRQNIAFPLDSMGVARPEKDRRVDEVIGRLGLEALARLYPGQLSGGDQQRVALARAMVRTPQLYLMDEPLGTLDADRRLQMRELIRAQQLTMGVTTLYVTHDQEEAMSLADRVVIMEGGKVRQSGPPAQVYDHPADLFVANFVGSPGMNFIDGEFVWEEGQSSFIAADGAVKYPLERPLAPGKGVLGVRPEFVRVEAAGTVVGEVVMDEYLGSCRNIHVHTACGRLALRVGDDQRFGLGERVALNFDAEQVRFFAADTGEIL